MSDAIAREKSPRYLASATAPFDRLQKVRAAPHRDLERDGKVFQEEHSASDRAKTFSRINTKGDFGSADQARS
jgi:hypothetical protein